MLRQPVAMDNQVKSGAEPGKYPEARALRRSRLRRACRRSGATCSHGFLVALVNSSHDEHSRSLFKLLFGESGLLLKPHPSCF